MKIVWLLYQQEDLSANRDYARLMRENGQAAGYELIDLYEDCAD